MREIEFLPDWYIKTQRRKKLLTVQFAASIVLAIFFCGWTLISIRNIFHATALLAERRIELTATADRVKERQTLVDLNLKLQNQSRIDASLGLNIESARVLKLLEQIMPESASLSELTINTDERPVAFTAGMQVGGKPPISRTLHVLVKGIAPSNEDVAAVLEGLGASKFCQELKLSYSTDKIENDRVLREFLIEFTIPLDSGRGQS